MKKYKPQPNFLILAVLLVNPISVFAQDTEGDPFNPRLGEGGDLTNPTSAYGLLGDLISMLFTLIIFAGALAALVYFIIGAIKWGSAGSGEGAAEGRKTMLYAAIGLIMLGLVYIFMLLYNSIVPSA